MDSDIKEDSFKLLYTILINKNYKNKIQKIILIIYYHFLACALVSSFFIKVVWQLPQ